MLDLFFFLSFCKKKRGLKNTDIEADDVVAEETSRGGGTKEEKADRGARGNETNRPATFTKPRPRATVVDRLTVGEATNYSWSESSIDHVLHRCFFF